MTTGFGKLLFKLLMESLQNINFKKYLSLKATLILTSILWLLEKFIEI